MLGTFTINKMLQWTNTLDRKGKKTTKQVTHFNPMAKALLFAWWLFCFVLCQNNEDGIRLYELYSSLHVVIITEGMTCQQVFSFNEHWGALASFFLSCHVSAPLVMLGHAILTCPCMLCSCTIKTWVDQWYGQFNVLCVSLWSHWRTSVSSRN